MTTSAAPKKPPPSDLRVVAVEITNFKRIRATVLEFKPGATAMTGRNKAGKSSALDAIASALGGAKLCPSDPIARGEREAKVKVKLAGRDGVAYVVTRRWWLQEGGGIESELLVDRADGTPCAKPQTVLDSLLGWKSKRFTVWDPFGFVLLGSTAEGQREQRSILCELAGLDFGPLDGERERVTERRKRSNADLERLGAEVAAVKSRMPPEVGGLAEERDLAAIAGKKADAATQKAGNDKAREGAKRARADAEAARRAFDLSEKAEAEAKRAWDAALDRRNAAMGAMNVARVAAEAAEANAAALVDPDTSAVDAEIAAAKEHNARVRAAQQQAAERRRAEEALAQKEADHAKARAASEADTARLRAIEAEKKAAAQAAKFPLPTLGVSDEGVILNGLPFSQASASEQLITVVRVCAALEPGIKTILVPERARIGLERLGELAVAAKETGIDLIVEHETPSPGFGIFFESGGVREVGPDFGRVPLPEAEEVAAEPAPPAPVPTIITSTGGTEDAPPDFDQDEE